MLQISQKAQGPPRQQDTGTVTSGPGQQDVKLRTLTSLSVVLSSAGWFIPVLTIQKCIPHPHTQMLTKVYRLSFWILSLSSLYVEALTRTVAIWR